MILTNDMLICNFFNSYLERAATSFSNLMPLFLLLFYRNFHKAEQKIFHSGLLVLIMKYQTVKRLSGFWCRIPKTIGVSIPMKATFFITYIMVDGWAGVAGEILRLKPLIFFHLKNFFLVKTEKDREEAMDPGSLGFNTGEPQIQLYFLLGLVYAVVSPILLPFIIVFFALAYVVYRHQVSLINTLIDFFLYS